MRKLLLPFSWIYGGITSLRNLLYDKGWFRSVTFNVPVICVGNITVGGTGKTPCIEYLIQLLSDIRQSGLVSRGYRRKTKGVVMADAGSDALTIGDEPYQIKQRFPGLPIVVSGDRVKGITHLLAHSKTNVVLMDDGFQHRAVQAGLYVMMMDYNRPIWKDHPFPAGSLRETASGRRRANLLIVNKCPGDMSEGERNLFFHKLTLRPEQHLFFTSINYGALKPFKHRNVLPCGVDRVVAVSGIANPTPFHNYLRDSGYSIMPMPFGDHHHFGEDDLKRIEDGFLSAGEGVNVVVVTEKDAARMDSMDLGRFAFANHLYYLPIGLEFLFNEKNKFDQLIKHYVGKNQ
ncbi:MAG: tetraacyldisaccharide 4'-kinase [Breznakibacter sp.]